VIVPFATSAVRIDAIAASDFAVFAIGLATPVVETRVDLLDTNFDLDAACPTPTLPRVKATVVTAITITLFFDDICMSSLHPVLHFVETLVIDYS
jgi:hypothetical protein